MPKTAYSKYYKIELDVEQLLAKINGEPRPGVVLDLSVLPITIRDWIRDDVVCPCCGRGGAQLVAAAGGKRAQRSANPIFDLCSQTVWRAIIRVASSISRMGLAARSWVLSTFRHRRAGRCGSCANSSVRE